MSDSPALCAKPFNIVRPIRGRARKRGSGFSESIAALPSAPSGFLSHTILPHSATLHCSTFTCDSPPAVSQVPIGLGVGSADACIGIHVSASRIARSKVAIRDHLGEHLRLEVLAIGSCERV